MEQINIHEAKTNFSKVIEKAVEGESFIITKAGKPVATLTAYSPLSASAKRVGFLEGMIEVPDDFDRMAEAEIQEMFEAGK